MVYNYLLNSSHTCSSISLNVCPLLAMIVFQQLPGSKIWEFFFKSSVRLNASVLPSCMYFYPQVFGFPPTEYHVLSKVEEQLEPFYKLWNMISDFQASRKEWLHGSFLGTLFVPSVFDSICGLPCDTQTLLVLHKRSSLAACLLID